MAQNARRTVVEVVIVGIIETINARWNAIDAR